MACVCLGNNLTISCHTFKVTSPLHGEHNLATTRFVSHYYSAIGNVHAESERAVHVLHIVSRW